MGRGKLPVKLIANEKARRATFTKRIKGLKKKAYELSTLCGVDTVLICYGPGDKLPETWPQEDPSEIARILTRYKSLSQEDRQRRRQGLSKYFTDQKRKPLRGITADDKLQCLQPAWDERLNDASEESLRELMDVLDSKAETARKRAEFLKSSNGKELVLISKMHEDTTKQVDAVSLYPCDPMAQTAYEYGCFNDVSEEMVKKRAQLLKSSNYMYEEPFLLHASSVSYPPPIDAFLYHLPDPISYTHSLQPSDMMAFELNAISYPNPIQNHNTLHAVSYPPQISYTHSLYPCDPTAQTSSYEYAYDYTPYSCLGTCPDLQASHVFLPHQSVAGPSSEVDDYLVDFDNTLLKQDF